MAASKRRPRRPAITFRLLRHDEITDIVPLLRTLNPALTTTVLRQRLREMATQGYECVGIFAGGRMIGCSGLWITTRYYVGRFIEPDNVVILPAWRGRGIGDRLMRWILAYGRKSGCVASELNCYVTNAAGQRFWFNQGYRILGYHFQRLMD